MIKDEDTFLFTFKDNQPKKFDILDKSNGFKLFDKSDRDLFSFGFYDILVYKSDVDNYYCYWSPSCFQNNNNYDYNKEKDALIGKEEFKIKQIQVFQMKENEEMKQQKKMIIYKTENKNWNLKSKKRKNNGIK